MVLRSRCHADPIPGTMLPLVAMYIRSSIKVYIHMNDYFSEKAGLEVMREK